MPTITGTNQADTITPWSVSPGVAGGPATDDDDLITTGKGEDQVSAGRGNDRVRTGNGSDDLSGDDGDDELDGRNGDDKLDGGNDNDALAGGRGDDWLHGGLGVDVLVGGRGDDTFAFGTIGGSRSGSFARSDTGLGEGSRDVVRDFQQGADIIDLSLLNWVSEAQGAPGTPIIPGSDLVFEFIGTDEFTAGGGSTPQLRYEVAAGRTIVQMDGVRNAGGPPPPDGIVDAEIELCGEIILTAADFIL